jgi:hypothetical protein
VIEFKQKFLSNDFLSIAIDSEENNAKLIGQKLFNPLKKLKDIISKGYQIKKQSTDRKNKQILNEISFYKRSKNYE